jgi:parallel beta-helix repeat protein
MFKKGFVSGIIILFVGTCIVSALNIDPMQISRTGNSGNYLYVGGSGLGNYSKIQDAIDNASNGDTVFVYDDSSPYNEDITIYKSIHLISVGQQKSVIIGGIAEVSDSITIIQIDANNCGIDGFIITRNDDAIAVGININSSNNKIINNAIINITEGIVIQPKTQNNTIIWNTITNNHYGIHTDQASNNTYANNIITSNSLYGIYNNYNSNENIFSNNLFSQNNYALRIKSSQKNTVHYNRFISNSWGLYVCCGSTSNYFYTNNLLNNSEAHVHEDSNLINIWYDSLNLSGNYWDDYIGIDANGDGIGDTPYNISNADNQDLYPLMKPWSNPPDTPTITGEINGEIQTSYEYTIQTTDPDHDDVQYYIDWGDHTFKITDLKESGVQIMESHMWSIKGTYSVKVKAIDEYSAESDWATLPVTMPYSFNKPLPQFLELLFHRFPNAFPLLRQLFG